MAIKAQVVISHASGIVADAVVNTFHFAGAAPSQAHQDAIVDAITKFYTVAPGGAGVALQTFITARMAQGARIKLYDMDEPKPRVPIEDVPFALVPSAAGTIPAECAAVLSYHSALPSGVNHARRRGRIYIGPLGSNAFSVVGGKVVIEPGFRELLRECARDLMNDADLIAANRQWVVYSAGARDNSDQEIPYKERPLLAPTEALVIGGWVDDAPDTQRRRGEAPVVRDLWDVDTPAI